MTALDDVIMRLAPVDVDESTSPSVFTSDHEKSLKRTITVQSRIPILPSEIMAHIFEQVQATDPSSLRSLMKVNKRCYDLAWPMFYDTIYLNRSTLPGLANFMNGDHVEHKKDILAKVTTLVIDDIQVMFCFEYDAHLKKFCDTIVLPNATMLVWREDQIRSTESHPARRGLREESANIVQTDTDGSSPITRWSAMSGRPARYVPPWKVTLERPTRHGPHSSRIEEFANVLPAKDKTICIRLPSSGRFQQLGPAMIYHHSHTDNPHFLQVTDRNMAYIAKLSGKKQIRIHQPVSRLSLTLSNIPNATYTFYSNSDQIYFGFKPTIIDTWERTMRLKLGRDHQGWRVWTDTVDTAIAGILMDELNELDREAKTKACIDVIRDSRILDRVRDSALRAGLREMLSHEISEVIAALETDQEPACPCCGGKGGPLDI